MHGKVRGKGRGQNECEARAVRGLGHGRQDEEVGQRRGGAGNARSNGKGIKQKAGHVSAHASWIEAHCVPGCNGCTTPSQVFARRGEQARGRSEARVGDASQCIRAQQIDGCEEEVGGKRSYSGIWQQGEQRQQEGRLVVDAAVVGRDIVCVEEDAFLHCVVSASSAQAPWRQAWRTSLEARHWRGDLDAASKETGQRGEDGEEEQTGGGGCSEEQQFLPPVNGHGERAAGWAESRAGLHGLCGGGGGGGVVMVMVVVVMFWQHARRRTLVGAGALTAHPCPLAGRISNFFAPAKSCITTCTDFHPPRSTMAGRSKKKGPSPRNSPIPPHAC